MVDAPAPTFYKPWQFRDEAKDGRERPLRNTRVLFPEDVQIGDVLNIPFVQGYGGHGATILVEKINKKSWVGREIKGSYRQGQTWRLSKSYDSTHIEEAYTSTERLEELGKKWNF